MPLGQKKTSAMGLGKTKSNPSRGENVNSDSTSKHIKLGHLYIIAGMGPMKLRKEWLGPGHAVEFENASGYTYWANIEQVCYEVNKSELKVWIKSYQEAGLPEIAEKLRRWLSDDDSNGNGNSNPPYGERTWEGWIRDEETGWYSEESRKRGDPQSYVVFIMNFSHGAGDLDRYQAEFGQFMGTTIPITGNVYCDIVKALNEARDFMQQYHRIEDLDAWFNKYHARQTPHSYDTYKMVEPECFEKWKETQKIKKGQTLPRGENPRNGGYRVDSYNLVSKQWTHHDIHPNKEAAERQVARMIKAGFKPQWVRIVEISSPNPQRGENPEGKTFRVSLLVGSRPPRNEVEILHMGPMATRVDATEAIKRMPKYWRERMEILAIDEVKKGER